MGINGSAKFEILTKTEREFLKNIAKQSIKIDYFALSFACRMHDIEYLENELLLFGFESSKILLKIESYDGIRNVKNLLRKASGIIIARGDLAINIKLSELYNVEKVLLAYSHANNKICIMATQLLEKYVLTDRLGYSEINDIMFAIREKADYLMLCGESSGQLHPFDSIKILKCLIESSKA